MSVRGEQDSVEITNYSFVRKEHDGVDMVYELCDILTMTRTGRPSGVRSHLDYDPDWTA